MDKYGVIDKAHNALIQHLSDGERRMFAELTPEHQRYLVGWCVRYEENDFLDDVPVENCIQRDIENCIDMLQGIISKLMNTNEGREQWEEWLGLKTRIRDVLEIDELIRLLFHPYEIRAASKRVGMHKTAGWTLAGFIATEGYIEPYRYPWQTSMKNIIFKEMGVDLPNVRGWTQRDREMFYAELPVEIKVYAQIKIDDLEATAKQLPPGGYMHPARMIPVWKSYLSSVTTKDSPQLAPPVPKKNRSRKSMPLVEACFAVWKRQTEQGVMPVSAHQLINVASQSGVDGYPKLSIEGGVIVWGEKGKLEMKHFVKAFEEYVFFGH